MSHGLDGVLSVGTITSSTEGVSSAEVGVDRLSPQVGDVGDGVCEWFERVFDVFLMLSVDPLQPTRRRLPRVARRVRRDQLSGIAKIQIVLHKCFLSNRQA
jgi:hypothetical protein